MMHDYTTIFLPALDRKETDINMSVISSEIHSLQDQVDEGFPKSN